MFYFHTPYYGYDELFLDAEERAPVIDRLLACSRAGLPVLNSRAGLLALRSGRWTRRARLPRSSPTSTASRLLPARPTGAAWTAGTPPAPRSSRRCACGPARCWRWGDTGERAGRGRLARGDPGGAPPPRRPASSGGPSPGRRRLGPAPVERTSLYLHVPFCRNGCPYCPYTKLPYRGGTGRPTTRRRSPRTDRWAAAVGPAGGDEHYIGGGTPTLALEERRRASSSACASASASPATCASRRTRRTSTTALAGRLREAGRRRWSPWGCESFHARTSRPSAAATHRRRRTALARLAAGGFKAVNADLMFALPGQTDRRRGRRPRRARPSSARAR